MSDVRYVVAEYTHGSFHAWATDPMDTLEEAEEFIQNPPDVWTPRPQDDLVILELTSGIGADS